MLTLALLAGLWTTTCIQTQMGGLQGYVKESYTFETSGYYEFKRDWYSDPICEVALDQTLEAGDVKLGKKISGMFISGDTFEADFLTDGFTDLGAVSVSGENLKVARGMKGSTFRNSMLGIFIYKKAR